MAGTDPTGCPVEVDLRLPQELLVEMLGVSRQNTAVLVRETVQAGRLR
jgi:hypothetical protein